jgi:hypothetical protein
MIKTMTLFLAFLFTTALNSYPANNDTDIKAFYEYLSHKVIYPEQAKLDDLQGNSQLLFTIKDGKLADLKIKTELGGGCDIGVLNSVLSYPNLKTLKNGKYALITTFKLDGSSSPIKNQGVQSPSDYIALKLTVVAFANAKSAATGVNVQGYGNDKAFKVNWSGNGVVLRGARGINDPKVYIDSVEVAYGGLNNINPNQIQAIEILKGESAVLTYGPGAINGVIIITTKKVENRLAPKKEPAKND